MTAKMIAYGTQSREHLRKGVNFLADARRRLDHEF